MLSLQSMRCQQKARPMSDSPNKSIHQKRLISTICVASQPAFAEIITSTAAICCCKQTDATQPPPLNRKYCTQPIPNPPVWRYSQRLQEHDLYSCARSLVLHRARMQKP
jgi:hypothetical protein